MKSSPSLLRPSGADAAAPAVQEGRVTTLLDGANHVAILTNDTARLHAFYREVFDATVSQDATHGDGTRLSFVDIGASTELNVFEVTGNLEAQRQTRCSGAAASPPGGVEGGIRHHPGTTDRSCASDGFVTDFGPILTLFFRDPEGLEAEVCVQNPAARPGVYNEPGTPAPGYEIEAEHGRDWFSGTRQHSHQRSDLRRPGIQ